MTPDELPLEDDPVLEGAFAAGDTHAFVAVVLHLSYLRSQLLVADALARRYPTEEAWQALLNDPLFQETIRDLSEIVADLRDGGLLGLTPDPAALAAAAQQHHGRALEAVEDLAQALGVDPHDLLTVLIRT